MDITITVWICIATAMAAMIIFRGLRKMIRRQSGKHKHRLIEFGSEHDEIWIPGDMVTSDIDRYDNAEYF